MASRITELRGQDFDNLTPIRRWIFRDYDTSLDVDSAIGTAIAAGTIPLYYGGIPLDTGSRSIQELGSGEWYVTLRYSSNAGAIIQPGAGAATQPATPHGSEEAEDQPVEADIDFSVRGATQRTKQSIATIQSVKAGGGEARNFGRAIGVNPETGEVEGADILTPEINWSRSVQIPAASFTGKYAKYCELMVGKVNAGVFFGYAIGECLCTSITVGKANGTGYRPSTFEFNVKRNRTTVLTILDDPLLELDEIAGHSYVWTTYKEQDQTVGGVKVKRLLPHEMYEEQVYYTRDFALVRLEELQVSP